MINFGRITVLRTVILPRDESNLNFQDFNSVLTFVIAMSKFICGMSFRFTENFIPKRLNLLSPSTFLGLHSTYWVIFSYFQSQ